MGNKANSRVNRKPGPKEIVKLLRKCQSGRTFYHCGGCPYFSPGRDCDELLLDAAAVIEGLMSKAADSMKGR